MQRQSVTEVVGLPTPAVRARISRLVADSAARDGAKSVSDAALLAPAPDARHFLVDEGGADLQAYAVLDPQSATAEIVVGPEHRGAGLGSWLLDVVMVAGARRLWAHGELPGARALAERHGMTAERTLLLMTRPLPWTGEVSAPPAPLALRPYAGAADDAAVLTVNAAAFVDLPDQGSWTAADLTARTSADWFDPADLLLLVDPSSEAGARVCDGRLAGFHWTKMHSETAGEVYVVALHPDYQGRGLGAPLTIAGLVHLTQRGCRTVGLFVDAVNTSALALYRRLGFHQDRCDVLFGLPGG